jgi:FixJ family two-component response regulator/anti-sigma regulatory factor (Ser/Thr protein kinase)
MAQCDVLVVDDDDATREGLCELLALSGFSAKGEKDGAQALELIRGHEVSVVLLDVLLPGLGGLDVLAQCAQERRRAKIIIMTGLDTPETALGALRDRAYDFLAKPIEPARLIEVVRRALTTPSEAPIEVLSARPEWLELLVPCTREAADRIQSFVHQLETDLPTDIRESVGLAFRELLLNGIEWGGHLNPAKTVRVACVRTRRMLLYRIADPGTGFRTEELQHAAGSDAAAAAIAHDQVREQKGLRPGGFGLVLIRAIADELVYNEQRNEVVFVKYLDALGDRHISNER